MKRDRTPGWVQRANILEKEFSVPLCLAPPCLLQHCSAIISRSHTIPRGKSLTQIARNGHVFSCLPRLRDIAKRGGGAEFKPGLIGVNKASTFKGFCNYHDNELFRCLEDENFTCTDKQRLMLTYRSVAHALYTKSASATRSVRQINEESATTPEGRRRLDGFVTGLRSSLDNARSIKQIVDDRVVNRDFKSLEYLRIRLNKPPLWMASSCISPEMDFLGKQIQDLNNLQRKQDLISVNCFYGGQTGEFILVWLPDSVVTGRRFADSLITLGAEAIEPAIVHLLFGFIENLYLAPSWWQGLSATMQKKLVRRMAIAGNAAQRRPLDWLSITVQVRRQLEIVEIEKGYESC